MMHDGSRSGLPGYSLFRRHHTFFIPRFGKGFISSPGMSFRHSLFLSKSVDWRNGGAKGFTQCPSCAPQVCCSNELTLFDNHSSQSFKAGRHQFVILDPLKDWENLLVEVLGHGEVALHRRYARQSERQSFSTTFYATKGPTAISVRITLTSWIPNASSGTISVAWSNWAILSL